MTSGCRAVFFDAGYTLLCMHPDQQTLFLDVCAELGVEIEPGRLTSAIESASALLGPREPPPMATPVTDADVDRFWTAYNRSVLSGCAARSSDIERAEVVYKRFAQRLEWRVYDDVRPVLHALQERGIALGVISNWTGDLEHVLRGIDLHSPFAVIVDSGVLGHEKPHAPIFLEALRLANIDPHEGLHVGDSPEADVEGALASGMKALLLDRQGRYPDYTRAPRVTSLHELLDFV